MLHILLLTLGLAGQAAPAAPPIPAEYQPVLTFLNRQGDFADNVFRINIPRNDLKVTVAGVATPTPFGFGGWLAMTKGTGGDVMMGDLVLQQDEVAPVMSALLDNGLEVTALHNHFYWEEPRLAYMHVHGHGDPMDLARRVKPALDLIGKGAARRRCGAGRAATAEPSTVRSWRRSSARRACRPARSTRSPSPVPTEDHRDGRADQLTHGPEHVGLVRRHQRQGGHRRRHRDEGVRNHAGAQGAARAWPRAWSPSIST